MKTIAPGFREKIFITALLVSSAVSLGIFLKYRTAAFPEHHIKFDISREQATTKSLNFAQDLGLSTETYRNATIFTIEEPAKTYLERELGVEETARLASSALDVWHFETRFFKELQKEEFTFSFHPDGRFVGYRRDIEEAAPGARLGKDEAQRIAEAFLVERAEINIAEWKLVSSESQDRPERNDHSFTWEREEYKAKDATARITVGVLGDVVGLYKQKLKIPEEWERRFETERSDNLLAQSIAEFVSFFLFGFALIIFFILKYRSHQLRMRFALWVGLVGAVVSLLASLNSIPLNLFFYQTTKSWIAFLGGEIFGSVIGALFSGLNILFVVAAGEALYRSAYPTNAVLEDVVFRGIRTRQVQQSLLVGSLVGFASIAYQIGYYFLGKQFGYWSPAEVNYTELFNTVLPWVYPLLVGFAAAVVEEGTFRLFGISFLKKPLRSTWAAVFVTSVVWAFLHSIYPQSPWFARGVELTLFGMLLSLLFLRFGILSSIAAHYSFNAFLTASVFFGSGSVYAIITSVATVLLPLIAAGIGFVWARRNRMPVPTLRTNEECTKHLEDVSRAVTYPTEVSPTVTAYRQLNTKLSVIVGILVIASAGIIWILGPMVRLRETPVSIDRNEARQIAIRALTDRDIDQSGYRSVVTFRDYGISSDEKEYIVENGGYSLLQNIVPDRLPPAAWSVRFFKPLELTEYRVEILSDGTLRDVSAILDEKAPGANLTEEEAQVVAVRHLSSEHGINIGAYKVVERSAEKRDARTDHRFIFETQEGKIRDAVFRVDLDVLGDQPYSFSEYLHVPEEWTREKQKTTALDAAAYGILIIGLLALVALEIKTSLRFLRERKISIRRSFLIGVFGVAPMILASLNRWPTKLDFYFTSIPPLTFFIISVVLEIILIALAGILFVDAGGMLRTLWRESAGIILPKPAGERRIFVRDAIITGYTLPIIWLAVQYLIVWLQHQYREPSALFFWGGILGADTILPFLETFGYLPLALAVGAYCGIAILLLRMYLRRTILLIPIAVVFAVVLSIPGSRDFREFILSLLGYSATLVVASVFILVYIRKNMLALVMAPAVSFVFVSGLKLFLQNESFLRINGVILVVSSLLPLVFFLVTELRKHQKLID